MSKIAIFLTLALLSVGCASGTCEVDDTAPGGWCHDDGDPVANAKAVGNAPESMCDLSDDGTGHARTQQLRGCWEASGVRCSVCNYTCTLPGIVCVDSCAACPAVPAPGGAPAPTS